MVKLMKFINGKWMVVDFGLRKFANVYARLGFIVTY
jgi:hypothetical protein